MIHCSCLKSACSTRSSVGRIAGMLEISRPNIRQERQIAVSAATPRRVKAAAMEGPFDSVVAKCGIDDARDAFHFCPQAGDGLIQLELGDWIFQRQQIRIADMTTLD